MKFILVVLLACCVASTQATLGWPAFSIYAGTNGSAPNNLEFNKILPSSNCGPDSSTCPTAMNTILTTNSANWALYSRLRSLGCPATSLAPFAGVPPFTAYSAGTCYAVATGKTDLATSLVQILPTTKYYVCNGSGDFSGCMYSICQALKDVSYGLSNFAVMYQTTASC